MCVLFNLFYRHYGLLWLVPHQTQDGGDGVSGMASLSVCVCVFMSAISLYVCVCVCGVVGVRVCVCVCLPVSLGHGGWLQGREMQLSHNGMTDTHQAAQGKQGERAH